MHRLCACRCIEDLNRLPAAATVIQSVQRLVALFCDYGKRLRPRFDLALRSQRDLIRAVEAYVARLKGAACEARQAAAKQALADAVSSADAGRLRKAIASARELGVTMGVTPELIKEAEEAENAALAREAAEKAVAAEKRAAAKRQRAEKMTQKMGAAPKRSKRERELARLAN